MMAASDLSSLYVLLGNTLSPQETLRKEAEAQLENISQTPGFGVLLLQVAASNGSDADAALRQAAAVYFKNLVNKRYDPYEEGKVQPLSEEDKTTIRGLMVSAVIECAPSVRSLLIATSHKIIRADYPKKWPTLVDELYPFIVSDASERVISALGIFHEVVSWHAGTSSGETRELIHGRVFSVLLGILQSKLEGAAAVDRDSVRIVKSILKSFQAAIQYRFSTHLLLDQNFSKWCTAITQVIQMPVPAEILSLSAEEAEANMYWKMKKWAVRIHNKIFMRYGCSKLDSFNNPDNKSFAKFYMDHVALVVLNVYLGQIQASLEGRNPITERIYCLICDFLESALRHKKTWAALESNIMDLISHFMFPRICFSPADQEMWEEDPEEYVRVKLDPFDEIYSVETASINFITDLVKCRKSSAFVPVLQFINSILSAPSTDNESVHRKDGALFLLGSMSRILMNSTFSSQVEPVIANFVIPELKSKHGFLRMRACWAIEQYDELKYSSATCLAALEGVLLALSDADLPVRVASSSALGALLECEHTLQALPPHLPKVMEAILALANQIQLDSVSFVLEKLVQVFSDNLAPYSVQLCTQLRDTVARNLEGYSNVLDVDVEDDNFGQNTDKMMAIVGMFATIESLIDAMRQSPELVAQMEEIVMPLLAMVFDRRIIDVYEEVFELLESITFSRKMISPSVWSLFPYIHRTFHDVGVDYIQDMWTTLDNYISYGSATLVANESFLQMLMDIIKYTMTDDAFGEHDRVFGCRLMESILLNCRGSVDAYIPAFIGYVLPTLSDPDQDSVSVIVHHLEVIINAIYYNVALALSALESLQATGAFFALWFNRIDKFSRVHDKRLVIMALSQLLAVPTAHLPPVVQQNCHVLLPIYLNTVESLPKAMEARRKMQDEEENGDDSDDSDFDDIDEDDFNEIQDNDDEDNHVGLDSNATSTATAGEEEYNFEDDDEDGFEDELEEELYFETALDRVDVAAVVQQTAVGLVQTQPQLLQQLTPEQATFMQSLLPK